MITSVEQCSKIKDEISKINFRGVEMKKSEISLKSESLHPCSICAIPPRRSTQS